MRGLVNMLGRVCVLTCAAMAAAGLLAQGLAGDDSPASDGRPRAALEGDLIPLSSVMSYHCHDADWPVISCFRSGSERDTDLTSARSLAATPYVTVFADADYGGGSLTATVSYADLGILGWSNAITSFKSLNGQHPKFWEYVDYGLPAWQWTAGAWVANVGSGANDRFSALRNVP